MDPIVKLFWPNGQEKCQKGYIVGWNVRDYLFCAAAVLSNVDIDDLSYALERLPQIESSSLSFMSSMCKGLPTLIGFFSSDPEFPPCNFSIMPSAQDIDWKIYYCDIFPRIPLCKVQKYFFYRKLTEDGTEKIVQFEIFRFDRPNPITLKYLSMDPLSVDIHTSFVQPEKRNIQLARKLDVHVKNSPFPRTSKNDMEHILNQVKWHLTPD